MRKRSAQNQASFDTMWPSSTWTWLVKADSDSLCHSHPLLWFHFMWFWLELDTLWVCDFERISMTSASTSFHVCKDCSLHLSEPQRFCQAPAEEGPFQYGLCKIDRYLTSESLFYWWFRFFQCLQAVGYCQRYYPVRMAYMLTWHHHSTMLTPLPLLHASLPSLTSPLSPCCLSLLSLVPLLILRPSKFLSGFASSQACCWCICLSSLAVPHPLQITLCLIYHLKCHLSHAGMAAGLGEGRRKGGGCDGLGRHGRHSGHSRCGEYSPRLSSPRSPPSRSLQVSPSCVPVLSPQKSAPLIGILSKLMPPSLLSWRCYPLCGVRVPHQEPGHHRCFYCWCSWCYGLCSHCYQAPWLQAFQPCLQMYWNYLWW